MKLFGEKAKPAAAEAAVGERAQVLKKPAGQVLKKPAGQVLKKPSWTSAEEASRFQKALNSHAGLRVLARVQGLFSWYRSCVFETVFATASLNMRKQKR